MALTQEQVDAWFAANPNATADEVAAAVKSVGGLDANEGLAGMIANRYSIAEPEVTNYYNAFTAPVDTPDNAPDDTPTPPASVPTFTDAIVNPPTTQDELITAISTPVTPPADNITSTGGVTKSATRPTSGGVSNVIEGDDIDTQIDQLPEEYASWSRSADQRSMELIRKSDGAILDRRAVGDFSDLDLIKMGLSFVPGAGQVLSAINIADAVRTGDLTKAAIGATGLVPGMANVNTALKVGKAIDDKNPFGAITALAGNTDLQKLTGFGDVNVGGFTAKDATAAVNLAKAAGDGNAAGVLTSLGTLTGSSDTVLAGKALSLYNRIQNGDVGALTEAVSLTNTLTGGTGSTTGTTNTTVGNFDDTEVTRLKGLGYTKEQIQDYFKNLDNLTEVLDTPTGTGTIAGTDTSGNVTLPGGVTLASTGDGVFRTDVGGVPTYAESSNAAAVKAPLGYSLLSMSEADNKPEGAYYDITANAWFKPDTTVTNLTGGTAIASDADLFNTSIGDLDKLDDTRTGDDYADFLKSIGITNTTQLTDSGLSNQDILDMINAGVDTVNVTGSKTTSTTGTTTPATTGTSTPTDLGTVTVVDKKCKPGFVYDEDLKQCVPIETVTVVAPPVVPPVVTPPVVPPVVTPPVVTPPVVTPPVVPPPVVTPPVVPPEIVIVDKKCDPGYVYDEDLKQCVPIVTPPVVTPPVVTPPVVKPPVVTPPVVKPPAKKVTLPSFVPSTGSYVSEDRTDPIYAEGMDDFDLFATLEELLADNSDKTDKKKGNKKSKDKTKMATGGHLDDLLAEQMTVDDLLKLLR